jgi:hypothetical protein
VASRMADAKGAFVTRALEKLLKDSAGRKYVALQKASKAYLGQRPILDPDLARAGNFRLVIFPDPLCLCLAIEQLNGQLRALLKYSFAIQQIFAIQYLFNCLTAAYGRSHLQLCFGFPPTCVSPLNF